MAAAASSSGLRNNLEFLFKQYTAPTTEQDATHSVDTHSTPILVSLLADLRAKDVLSLRERAAAVYSATGALGPASFSSDGDASSDHTTPSDEDEDGTDEHPQDQDKFAAPIARDILALVAPHPDTPLVRAVLESHIKPLFARNPHPYVNPTTGRKLARPAGGAHAAFDHFEGQEWKAESARGAIGALYWCITNTTEDAYESLWPLLVPPLMALLSDFDAPSKLSGVRLAHALLRTAPAPLLTRTGLDALLAQALRSCLTHLHDPHTPALIRATIPVTLLLIARTTRAGSRARFDALAGVLGEGVLGSVWMYAARDAGAIRASLEVLPQLLDAMQIGAARFLKALVPQLVHPLRGPEPGVPSDGVDDAMRLAALRALLATIDVCAVRMYRWKGTILDGVVRCWVQLHDAELERDKAGGDERDREAQEKIRTLLKEVCKSVARACPSVVEDEFQVLLKLDRDIFEGLVGGLDTPSGSDPAEP